MRKYVTLSSEKEESTETCKGGKIDIDSVHLRAKLMNGIDPVVERSKQLVAMKCHPVAETKVSLICLRSKFGGNFISFFI